MTHPHEYHWVLGNFDHIEFPNGGDPVPAAPTQMSAVEGVAVISDASGSLLMYTDGVSIWDGSLTNSSQVATFIGGNTSTTQSAIIVPPAGGGTNYHVFAVRSDDSSSPDNVVHSTYQPGSGTVTQIITPHPISDIVSTSFDNTERIAATSHADCEKFWLLFQDGQSSNLHALLIDSDEAPTTVVTSTSSLQQSAGREAGYMKVSPDGTIMAYCDFDTKHVVILAFDNATGLFTDMHEVTDTGKCYGLEFSPDSQTIYIASIDNPRDVRAHTITNGTEAFSTLPVISSGVAVWAMQLAPNGKIYGKKAPPNANLLEIGQPNTPLTPAVVPNATYADGSVITLSTLSFWKAGLPTFTRISDACSEPRQNQPSYLFPWFSATVLNHHSDQAVEPLTPYISSFNRPGPDLTAHQSMSPLNADARLVDISVFKDKSLFAGYTDTIDFSLVVLDFAGNILRTISTANIDFQAAPDAVWLPVTLSTNGADTTILAGEVVAGQILVGSPPSQFGHFPYQMTGRGRFV